MTPNEIISTIKHSNVPTICVEGVQDRAALRRLEDDIGGAGLILPCGGRGPLFEVWSKREEFRGKSVAFLADKDLYVFSQPPEDLNGIIFTTGYSMENDIVESERWKDLFSNNDRKEYNRALRLAMCYYWKEVTGFFDKGIRPNWTSTFKLVSEEEFAPIPAPSSRCQIWRKIKRNPGKYLRGKNYLECVHYSLSYKSRAVKYSRDHVLEISCKPSIGTKYRSLVNKLKHELRKRV